MIKALLISSLVLVLVLLTVQFKDKGKGKVEPLRAEKQQFLIGAAANYKRLASDKEYRNILSKEFNVMTVENDLKFINVHPAKDRYNFYNADKLIEFAKEHNIKVRGHTLVWHGGLPQWLKEGNYTKTEMEQILKQHIQKVVGHYRGEIYAWDVVNEAFNNDGSLRDTIWLEAIGPDYIKKSFRWAHAADPNAVLFYNDYGIGAFNKKSDAVYKMLRELTNEGVPVHGVGFQMHTSIKQNIAFSDIENNMRRIHAIGLQVQITEFDVDTSGVDATLESKLSRQAEVYSRSLKTCINSNGTCTAFVIWGISDKYSWLGKEARPLMYDSNYIPKPAYYALKDILSQ